MTSLQELYNNPLIGLTSELRFFNNLKKKDYHFTKKQVKDFIAGQSTAQIHSEVRQVYLPIQVSNIRNQFQIDLLVLVKSKAYVPDVIEGIRKTDLGYIFVCVDTFSRKADCRYISNKTPVLCLEALKEIISNMGKPKQIQSDKGNEFMGVFKKYCGDNGIELNMSDKDGKLKNSIAERFNRTLIGYIKRYKTAYPRAGILQLKAVLPDFISNYNDSIHRTIGIEPQLAFDTDMIYKNRKGLTMTQRDKVFFKVGDMVRVRRLKDIYTKGREAIYSKQVFKIVKSKGNVYTLSAPYEGQLDWSYNSLLKIKNA